MEGVVVVEGSDRIGGRIKDAQFGGITVELGANWVHRLIDGLDFLPTLMNVEISGAHSSNMMTFLDHGTTLLRIL